MKEWKYRLIAQAFPTATLSCALMAIQTGSYSLSEKWGWSGFALSFYGIVTLVIQGIISGF